MKVFDFTDGKKGDLLGETKVANSTGGWFVEKNGSTFKVELANPRNVEPVAGGKAGIKWSWVNAATSRGKNEDCAIQQKILALAQFVFAQASIQ